MTETADLAARALSDRLTGIVTSDHKRLCGVRAYSCDCGYDAAKDDLIVEAAAAVIAQQARIERLEAALSDCIGPLAYAYSDKEGRVRHELLPKIRAALAAKEGERGE